MSYTKPLLATTISMLLSSCLYVAKPPTMPKGTNFRIIPAKINIKQENIGRLKYRGGIGLQSSDKTFGGFSGLYISPDLKNLTAIGRGKWLTGQLSYDQSGNLSNFSNKQEHPIPGLSGKPVTVRKDQDAESLFYDGKYFYTGFEWNNRIWRYQQINTAAQNVTLPPEALAGIPDGGGFSSLTASHNGKLLTLTESAQDTSGNTKGWLWSPGKNAGAAIYLRADQEWLPVDLAQLPNGDLLLAETWRKGNNKGFRNRLSVIDKSEVRAGNIMQAKRIATLQPPVYYKRIEAVYATKDQNGNTLVFTMADSGNNWPTDIMMFEFQ